MTNLDSILKSNLTLPTKVCLVKAMVFPVVMYRCESWTVKKAEHRRIDAFELWCWRRLLRRVDSLEKTLMLGGIGEPHTVTPSSAGCFWLFVALCLLCELMPLRLEMYADCLTS